MGDQHILFSKSLHTTHYISWIYCWKQQDCAILRREESSPVSPQRVLEVHSEEQRDLSKRGVRRGQREGTEGEMEKSNERLGYHTTKGMSRDPPLCVCMLIPGVVYQVCGPPGRMKGLSPHSGLDWPWTHTHTHSRSNEEFPFAASPINQEMN